MSWFSLIPRVKYERARRNVIVAQSAVRRMLAKKQLKKLKIEARSVAKQRELNKGKRDCFRGGNPKKFLSV